MSLSVEPQANMSETMTLDFSRFGECTFSTADILEFPWGLPGFPNLRRWLPLTIESQKNFIWLQSIDDTNVSLPTADPFAIFEDYDPKLPAYVVAALDITGPADFTLLGVVVVTEGAEEMNMNLFAPIVVNIRTGKARQIMLENSGYSIREAIPRKSAETPAQ